jgi:uncharacterized delta-60 repeat protein
MAAGIPHRFHSALIGSLLAALALAVTVPSAIAKSGDLDQSFAAGGRLTIGTPKEGEIDYPSTPMAMAAGPGGRAVAATRRRVLVLLDNGRPDRRFSADGKAGISAPDGSMFRLAGVAVDSHGRILVAGTTESLGGPSSGPPNFPGPPPAWATVYRYLPNGRLDPSFGVGGVVATLFGQAPPTGPGPNSPYPYTKIDGEYPYQTASVRVSGLTVSAQDRPIVAGFSVSRVTLCGYSPPHVAYLTRSYAARLTSDGRPDPSFGVGGVATDDYVEDPRGLGIGADGQIVYTAMPTGNRCPRVPVESEVPAVSFWDSNGVFHQRLAVAAKSPSEEIEVDAIAGDRRGRILLLLKRVAWESGQVLAMTVRRLLPDGSPDLSFGRRGSISPKIDPGARIVDLATDRRGRVLLAGSAPNPRGGGRGFLLMRLTAAGEIDRGFGRTGVVKTRFPRARTGASQVSVDGHGRILVGGTLTSPHLNTGYGLAFARYRGVP